VNFFFQCTWCSILYYFRGLSQCRLAGLLMCPLKWTTNIYKNMDVKLLHPVWKDFLDTVNTVVLTGYWKQLIIFLFDIQCMFQNCKKYHNQETTEKKFQSSWCSILYYFRGLSQCGLAGLLMCPLKWTTNIVHGCQITTPCVEGFPGYCKYCCFDRILKKADYFLIWHTMFVSKWIRMWSLDQNNRK
jgi:hypothetical protein